MQIIETSRVKQEVFCPLPINIVEETEANVVNKHLKQKINNLGLMKGGGHNCPSPTPLHRKKGQRSSRSHPAGDGKIAHLFYSVLYSTMQMHGVPLWSNRTIVGSVLVCTESKKNIVSGLLFIEIQFLYFNRYCFICRPSDSTPVRRPNSVRCHPPGMRSSRVY